jgi:hypothetical protein
MARTSLTANTAAAYAGGVLDIAAAAVDQPNGNSFANTGLEKVIVVNGSGGSLTVTVAIPANQRSLNGLATTKTYTVASAKTAILGPFDPSIFNQTTGVVNIDWSTGTSVTCSVVNHVPTPSA